MAGDVIFTEGSDAAATAVRQIETARQAQHQAAEVDEAAVRKQQTLTAGVAAGIVVLVVLLLIPVPRAKAGETAADTGLSINPAAAQDGASRAGADRADDDPRAGRTVLKAATDVATEFGRVRDLDELTRVLGRAAEVMDASGLMVWMGSATGGDLRPVLAHGYSAAMIARIPPVPRSADNAAASAYRSGTLQIVLSRPGGSSGAVVAPILSADGCIGALSAEIRSGGETSESVQALAAIFAAHLAGVLTAPARRRRADETDQRTQSRRQLLAPKNHRMVSCFRAKRLLLEFCQHVQNTCERDQGPDPRAHRAREGEVPAAAVHRHPRDDQERRDPRPAVRGRARRQDHVRRLVDRGLRAHRGVGHVPAARPLDVPRLPVAGDDRREGRADDLRHLHARRPAVHRRPARLPEESDRARRRQGLHDEGRPRGRVLPLPDQERRPDHRDPRRGELLRSEPGGSGRGRPPRDRPRARGDGLPRRGGAPRGRARASTRSTSATTMCWRRRTASARSGSW